MVTTLAFNELNKCNYFEKKLLCKFWTLVWKYLEKIKTKTDIFIRYSGNLTKPILQTVIRGRGDFFFN